MTILILAITLVGVITVVVVINYLDDDQKKEISIDKIVEQSVPINEITTNLIDGNYIRISFMIESNSKDAKEELEKRDFQVKNIVIEELSEMKSTDFTGKEGKISLENKIKTEINKLMQEGSVTNIYITSFILPQ